MKLLTTIWALLCALVIAAVSVFRREREECWNEISTTKTHAEGKVPFTAEVTFLNTRFALVQKGTAADGIIVNVANTRPYGVILDEPASGAVGTVAILGVTPGTLKMRASKSIAAGSKIWTAAAGKVTDTWASGAFFVGRAINAAAADGDLIEVQHCFPLLDASGTTL